MYIENINGCILYKDEEYVEDVLIVYCAKHPTHNFTTTYQSLREVTV